LRAERRIPSSSRSLYHPLLNMPVSTCYSSGQSNYWPIDQSMQCPISWAIKKKLTIYNRSSPGNAGRCLRSCNRMRLVWEWVGDWLACCGSLAHEPQ
jgi:hypothetical protein